MTQATRGPWRIRVNKNDDPDTCDLSICSDIFVLADITGPQYSHQHANARLISAAPDLLEAAYLARSYLADAAKEEKSRACRAIIEADIAKINAAIAKATGEHQ